MTRGKYAARASLRREDTAVRSEIGSYQHHVQRLTAENKELRAALDDERRSRKEESRFLRAMRDEGLSPEVMALREELERQRSLAASAQAETRRQREVKDKVFDFTTALLRTLTGCTGLEAMECLLREVTGEPATISDVDDPRERLSLRQVQTIQRTRRERSSPQARAELARIVQAAHAGIVKRTRKGGTVRGIA